MTNKKLLLIGIVVVVLLAVIAIGGFLLARNFGLLRNSSAPQGISVATDNQSTPTIDPLTSVQTVVPAITLTVTPTITPTSTQVPFLAGSLWTITKIDQDAYSHDGYTYDIGTFVNNVTGQTVTAHCAEPTWVSPPLSTQYLLTGVGVLYPVHENQANPYQRFIILQ